VIELDEPLGDEERMVIGEAGHARSQHDVARALGGGCDHDLGGGDQLPPRRVMLADPHLVIAQVVEPFDQLHVAIDGEGGILADTVKGREEDAVLHSTVGHGLS
jgi:hypothetical protein